MVKTYLSAKILNVAFAGSNLESLGFGSLKVLLLTYVGHEGNDLVSLILYAVSF